MSLTWFFVILESALAFAWYDAAGLMGYEFDLLFNSGKRTCVVRTYRNPVN